MKDFELSRYRAYGFENQRKAERKGEIDSSYDVGPTNQQRQKHDQSTQMYCDILGRKYCQACSEEMLRKTSFVQSISEAECFITKCFARTRTAFTGPPGKERERIPISRSWIEEDKVKGMVSHVFPIMFKALSTSSPNSRQVTTGKVSTRSASSRSTRKDRPKSTTLSMTSLDSSCSLEELNGDEKTVFERRNSQKSIDCSAAYGQEFHDINMEDKSNKTRIFPLILGRPEKSHHDGDGTNSIFHEIKQGVEKYINIAESREIPSKSLKKFVRRSSVVAKSLRTQSNEKLKTQIAKWTPAVIEGSPRTINPRKSFGDFGRDKKEIASRKTEESDERRFNSYLENTRRPKATTSMLPMEPVVCGIKYIRNRWMDEALYKSNYFAIKLNSTNS